MNGDSQRLTTHTVLACSEESLVLLSMNAMLDRSDAFSMTCSASRFRDVPVTARGHRPSLALVFLGGHMTSSACLQAMEEITRGGLGDTRLLVLSGNPNPHLAREVLRSGADSYVRTTEDGNSLERAMLDTANGTTYINPSLATLLIGHELAGTLTDRERQVTRLIALGLATEEISQQLAISKRTVEGYRSNIRRKLSIERRSELVRYAFEEGLVP